MHTSSAVQASSVRSMVALAWVFLMRFWLLDLTQMYLQRERKLAPELYIEPPLDLVLGFAKVLRVVRARYGLRDAG